MNSSKRIVQTLLLIFGLNCPLYGQSADTTRLAILPFQSIGVDASTAQSLKFFSEWRSVNWDECK